MKSKPKTPLQKYFEYYAEPEVEGLIELGPQGVHDSVVVIPCCGETVDSLHQLLESLYLSLDHQGKTAWFIWVFNESKASPREHVKQNQRGLEWMSTLSRQKENKDLPLYQWDCERGSHLVVNLTLERALSRGGVGLSRKIGGDMALYLKEKKHAVRDWYSYHTDGDVQVPLDYFKSIELSKKHAAFYFPFFHPLPPLLPKPHQIAILQYEVFLHYYREGLKSAGSPLTHHSLGSTLVIPFETYLKVRGFPPREAGEDFHILAKLFKLGPVGELERGSLKLSPRKSDRVPFGTGAAVTEICHQLEAQEPYQIYHPRIFSALKLTLEALCFFSTHREMESFYENLRTCHTHPLDEVTKEVLPPSLIEKLLRNHPDPSSLLRALGDQFDALSTLRWIHLYQKRFLPAISWHEAIDLCDFQTALSQALMRYRGESLEEILRQVEALEQSQKFRPTRPHSLADGQAAQV